MQFRLHQWKNNNTNTKPPQGCVMTCNWERRILISMRFCSSMVRTGGRVRLLAKHIGILINAGHTIAVRFDIVSHKLTQKPETINKLLDN